MPTRPVSWLAWALVASASGCVKHFECEVHRGAGVREVVTDHFVVASELPEADLREEGLKLELLWDTFAAYFHSEVPRARIPVVVLESDAVVESFAEGYSGFVQRRGTEVLVVGSRTEKGAANTNAHELTHLVSTFMLPRQPHWISEGLASYFEDATFKDARTVTMGRWNASRAEEAFLGGLLSIDELNQWVGLQFDDRETRYYASAWAYVHYLSNHDEARLKKLFEELRGTRPVAEVMREAFPPEKARQLQTEVAAYLREARFRGFETSLRRAPVMSEVRTLAPWQVHSMRSQLFLRDEKAVAAELATAVELAPTPKPAALAVAQAKARREPIAGLVAAYPSAPEVLGELTSDEGKDKRDEFAKAVALHPDDPQLLSAAASCELENGAFDAADALAVRGLALAPWSTALVQLRVHTALSSRRCDDAEAQLSRLESLWGDQTTAAIKKDFEVLRHLIEACRAPSR